MKILLLTQKIDSNDDVLGFMANWLKKMAEHFDFITVICLEAGTHQLPVNVRVLSLGKERKASRGQYLWRFYRYLWQTRHDYQAVLVHMNPEYIVLAAWFWRATGKKIYLWYNHKVSTWRSRLAARLANKVFYTSPYAWAAALPNSQIMPVGIDTDLFRPAFGHKLSLATFKILSLGRISPVKRIEFLLQAAEILAKEKIDFKIDIYGVAPERDRKYYQSLRSQAKDLENKGLAVFHPSLPNVQTPDIFRQHHLLVNLTPSGSFDKTILEAMSCGVRVLICNRSLEDFLPEDFMFKEDDVKDLVAKIKVIKNKLDEKVWPEQLRLHVVKQHSLELLAQKLEKAIAD